MIKRIELSVIFSALIVFVTTSLVGAAPLLELWISGEITGNSLSVEVHSANTGFGFGGLSYDLQLSEVAELTREYSDYGWVANDGLWDNSNPPEGSVPAVVGIARFDTVVEPVGTEFPPGSSGIVETLNLTGISPTPHRWFYIDLVDPQASDGQGRTLVSELGGSINVIEQQGLPETHTFGVFIPEPTAVVLLAIGFLGLRKRRRV